MNGTNQAGPLGHAQPTSPYDYLSSQANQQRQQAQQQQQQQQHLQQHQTNPHQRVLTSTQSQITHTSALNEPVNGPAKRSRSSSSHLNASQSSHTVDTTLQRNNSTVQLAKRPRLDQLSTMAGASSTSTLPRSNSNSSNQGVALTAVRADDTSLGVALLRDIVRRMLLHSSDETRWKGDRRQWQEYSTIEFKLIIQANFVSSDYGIFNPTVLIGLSQVLQRSWTVTQAVPLSFKDLVNCMQDLQTSINLLRSIYCAVRSCPPLPTVQEDPWMQIILQSRSASSTQSPTIQRSPQINRPGYLPTPSPGEPVYANVASAPSSRATHRSERVAGYGSSDFIDPNQNPTPQDRLSRSQSDPTLAPSRPSATVSKGVILPPRVVPRLGVPNPAASAPLPTKAPARPSVQPQSIVYGSAASWNASPFISSAGNATTGGSNRPSSAMSGSSCASSSTTAQGTQQRPQDRPEVQQGPPISTQDSMPCSPQQQQQQQQEQHYFVPAEQMLLRQQQQQQMQQRHIQQPQYMQQQEQVQQQPQQQQLVRSEQSSQFRSSGISSFQGQQTNHQSAGPSGFRHLNESQDSQVRTQAQVDKERNGRKQIQLASNVQAQARPQEPPKSAASKAPTPVSSENLGQRRPRTYIGASVSVQNKTHVQSEERALAHSSATLPTVAPALKDDQGHPQQPRIDPESLSIAGSGGLPIYSAAVFVLLHLVMPPGLAEMYLTRSLEDYGLCNAIAAVAIPILKDTAQRFKRRPFSDHIALLTVVEDYYKNVSEVTRKTLAAIQPRLHACTTGAVASSQIEIDDLRTRLSKAESANKMFDLLNQALLLWRAYLVRLHNKNVAQPAPTALTIQPRRVSDPPTSIQWIPEQQNGSGIVYGRFKVPTGSKNFPVDSNGQRVSVVPNRTNLPPSQTAGSPTLPQSRANPEELVVIATSNVPVAPATSPVLIDHLQGKQKRLLPILSKMIDYSQIMAKRPSTQEEYEAMVKRWKKVKVAADAAAAPPINYPPTPPM